MRFTPWATRLALTLSLTATAFLTACGGGGDGGGSTQVRLLNATQSYAALDLTVNDKTINSKVAYANVGDYGSVDTNNTATKVLTSDVGTSIAALTPTLAADTKYTLISYGFAGAVRTSLLQEAQTAPDSGKASLLVLNLAPDAGTLDVYVTTATEPLDTATAFTTGLAGGAGSGYIQINSGTYRLRVTGTTKRGTDLRLDIPAVTLDSASVNTLVLTSTSSGTLVNGMKLVQQGSVTNLPNTLSRVRAVHALSGTATASVSVQGNTLLPTSLPPNISNYTSLNAGASQLVVNVNGAAVGFPAPTLAAGADYTVLVWGDSSSPQLSVLTDDNRLPSVSGQVKMRLINGMSVANSLATLNVDYTSLASNVAPGASSTPSTVNSSTGSVVTVNSPLQLAPLYNPGANNSSGLTPLSANGVYTVLVMGDPTKPTGALVKDR